MLLHTRQVDRDTQEGNAGVIPNGFLFLAAVGAVNILRPVSGVIYRTMLETAMLIGQFLTTRHHK